MYIMIASLSACKSTGSYANGLTDSGHRHKAIDDNHESAEPRLELFTHELRLNATAFHNGDWLGSCSGAARPGGLSSAFCRHDQGLGFV